MILSGQAIINNPEIEITPQPPQKAIQPASIDLHLDNTVTYLPQHTHIDTKKEHPPTITDTIPLGGIEIQPNEFLLLQTKETIKLSNNYAALCEGRSSIGRLGLTIHITAGYTDPGYKGTLTLECKNTTNNTIKLYPGMRICQLIILEIKQNTQNYNGKYQNSTTPTPSKIHQDQTE